MVRSARRSLGPALAGLCTALAACAALAAPPPSPPPAAFVDPNGVSFVAIAPNGRLLARDDVSTGQTRILLWDVDTARGIRIVNLESEGKLRLLEWADDETLLVTASVQRPVRCSYRETCNYEWWRNLAVRTDATPPRVLLPDDLDRRFVTGSTVLAARTDSPHLVTLQTWDWLNTHQRSTAGTKIEDSERERTGWANVLYSVDTRTGKGRLLEAGTDYTRQWVLDRNGQPVARSEWNPEKGDYSIVVREGRNWRVIYRQSEKGSLALLGLAPDGKSIVALGDPDTDASKAWSIPLDGSPVSVLLEEPNGEIDQGIVDPATGTVMGLRTGGLQPKTHWLDTQWAAQIRPLERAFTNRNVTLLGRSSDGKRALIAVDGPASPTTFQLVDFDKSRADVVGEAHPALARVPLGDVRAIDYPARDGTRIPAYLTLPPQREPKNLPLVVLPHGGPHYHDGWEFDYLVQFLATRGYAVLQPQFRGSTGFGKAFLTAGYQQWGGLMQDDVTDGVKHLIADGTADPHRICIVGASYGGYAALAGATFTPDLYTCAASINGVSDLPALLASEKRSDGAESGAYILSLAHIGSPGDGKLATVSPARAAASVKVPVLILHGLDDSVVPIDQSERMARALEKAGKPFTFIKLPGEDHWLSRPETRLQVLTELEKFLRQYLH